LSNSSTSPTEALMVRPPEPPVESSAPEIQTCWQSIGVYGNRECQELKEFVHCRNCPVYSRAAQRLLDRPLPPDYQREWTHHFSKKQAAARPAKTSAVLFRIATEWLALPSQTFQEIAERRPIHSLPHRRLGVVLGLVNVRGELLICVSLGALLGLEGVLGSRADELRYDRLLVAQWQGHRLVFPVNEVHGIYRFLGTELRDAPATVTRSQANYTRAIFFWKNRPVGYLEPGPLFAALNRSLA
jgi:chemotaxis-related protein WspD